MLLALEEGAHGLLEVDQPDDGVDAQESEKRDLDRGDAIAIDLEEADDSMRLAFDKAWRQLYPKEMRRRVNYNQATLH